MISLSVQESIPGDLHQRRVTATIQPSALIKELSGIFIVINDNYILTENTGFAAASILTEKFESSVQRSEWIINQTMQLKDKVHV
jgi:hypothetical protein